MRNFNETNIITAVIGRLENCRTPRAKVISTALVRHLHDFVREVEPTQAEWEQAIDFLTGTGHMCNATRQEFILLSDALGVSMLVDAINHRLPGTATETTVLGPFYVQHAPEVAIGSRICDLAEGPSMLVEGSVRSVSGKALANASVDIWHADAAGFYDVQKDEAKPSGRARVRTDADGRFWVYGVVPAAYPIPNNGPVGQMLEAQGRHPFRPAHVHFMVAAPSHETLVTHLFLADSDYLDSDVVFGVKDTLIEALDVAQPGITPYGAVVEDAVPVLRRDFVLAESLTQTSR
ncbi:dioxygenase family protein [Bradyrhizobium sp. CCBAU 11361]|uniref:dioxygenase family protein n=1 Tax=Bradyrhizobium sp. CCBAU 11361 TaxID=1630812 RepID=UPI00230309C3|nr:dioxygenase [Bradyrhizobium sp. CCBAU 11361]MDA9489921.1 hydroxyquinol 1,2-dioxygenase [Bradyrhizobium sp. CCBAU 11361]